MFVCFYLCLPILPSHLAICYHHQLVNCLFLTIFTRMSKSVYCQWFGTNMFCLTGVYFATSAFCKHFF